MTSLDRAQTAVSERATSGNSDECPATVAIGVGGSVAQMATVVSLVWCDQLAVAECTANLGICLATTKNYRQDDGLL
jgi:hypothetical protein